MRFLMALISVFFFSATSLAASGRFVVMGTGDITGVYYPAGGAICRLLNKDRERHGIRCAVESTPGSTYNLSALRRGELDLAIVQSDWLYHAGRGSSIFTSAGADADLRVIMNLHSEELTIVARADSGIKTFEDLKGKRVNLGNPDSGQRRTMDLVLNALGWSYRDFEVATELAASEMSEALCSGRIDAFVYVVGHPNASVNEATTFCNSRLIPLPSRLIEHFSTRYPFYRAGVIKGALYRGNPDPIPTIQLSASLVAHASLEESVAFELAKAIASNFETFREMHPALQSIKREALFTFSKELSPVHQGVKVYLNSFSQ